MIEVEIYTLRNGENVTAGVVVLTDDYRIVTRAAEPRYGRLMKNILNHHVLLDDGNNRRGFFRSWDNPREWIENLYRELDSPALGASKPRGITRLA